MRTISHEQQDVFVRWDPLEQIEVRRRVTEHEYSTDLRGCAQCGTYCRVQLARTGNWSIYPGERVCNGCLYANETYQRMRLDRETNTWHAVGPVNPLAGMTFDEWVEHKGAIAFAVEPWALPSFDKAMGIRDEHNIHEGTKDEAEVGGFDEGTISPVE
jgi:hypothetical protein